MNEIKLNPKFDRRFPFFFGTLEAKHTSEAYGQGRRMSGASSLSTLKARAQTTVRKQPRDVYPDLEVKIQQQPTSDRACVFLCSPEKITSDAN